MNRQLNWIQVIGIVLGRSSNLVPWIRYHSFGQFWKLGFCLVSECEIFAHRYQIEGDCRFSPLEKYLLQTIIRCAAAKSYVTCCEVLIKTYFPSLSSKKYSLFFLIKVKGVVNLYVEVNLS